MEQQETVWIGDAAVHVSRLTLSGPVGQKKAAEANRKIGCLVLGILAVVVLGVLISILLSGSLAVFGISKISELAEQPEVAAVIEEALADATAISVESGLETTRRHPRFSHDE